jgi:hypothetical protein
MSAWTRVFKSQYRCAMKIYLDMARMDVERNWQYAVKWFDEGLP